MKMNTPNDGDERQRGERKRAAEGQWVSERGGAQEADLGKMWARAGTTETKGERETKIERGGVRMRGGEVELRELDVPEGR